MTHHFLLSIGEVTASSTVECIQQCAAGSNGNLFEAHAGHDIHSAVMEVFASNVDIKYTLRTYSCYLLYMYTMHICPQIRMDQLTLTSYFHYYFKK